MAASCDIVLLEGGMGRELIGGLDENDYGALMRQLAGLKETVQAKLRDGNRSS